jgi:ABC-2 type transport system ATP-binding protein
MKPGWAIEANELRKSFGKLTALDGTTFHAEAGEILGLLGPNGAGKSTTISILCGLARPDSGEASVMGHSLLTEATAAKAALGYVPQDIALYGDMTARENLDFWGRMYGLRGPALRRRIDEVLETIGLAERQKDKVSGFSGGMKRRVNIGAAILHRPAVVVMDEPTVGIDPQSRRHILDGVKELNRQGTTVLYTTHYMEEAAELSRHIAVMDKGRVIAYGTHEELLRMVGSETRVTLSARQSGPEGGPLPEAAIGSLRGVPGVKAAHAEEASIGLLVDGADRVLPRILETATAAGLHVASVNIEEPSLESVFLHLTGRALRE